MYKYIPIWLVLIVACFSVSGQAQNQIQICSSSTVPDGWVIIQISTDFTKCNQTPNDIYQIEQISTLGTGATVNACANSVLPAGWVFTDETTSPTTCANNNIRALLNLNGEPPGAQSTVCQSSIVPSGWVVQNFSTDFTRCSNPNQNNLRIFLNLNGLALGTQETVCTGNILPTAWVITGHSTDPTRCGGGNNNLDVIALTGNFSLSASPGSQTVVSGNTTSFNVSMTRSAGFTGPISLSTSGLPSDANPTFNPNPAPGASSTLTVTGGANAITFHPIIKGLSGNVPSSTQPQVTLNVTDFSLSLNPASLTVVQGGSTHGQVIITPINGFAGLVQLGPSNVPDGDGVSFNPNPATTSSTMTVTANGSGPLGTFQVQIDGFNQNQRRDPFLTLTVAGFTLSVNPATATVPPGGSTLYQVTVNPSGGYSGSVCLSVSGLPSGVTASFNPVCTTGSSTMNITNNGAAAGTYTLTIKGTDANQVSKTATVTLIVGPLAVASQFMAITPCRVADTRNATGPFGGPFLAGGATREFDIPNSACNIPSTALGYAVNITVVPHGTLGYLTMFPCGQNQPATSNLNSMDGRVKAVAAIVPAGTHGGACVFATNDTDLVLDISGYFVAAGTNSSALAFYPLTPCRVADTRNAPGSLGGPSLVGGATRTFPIRSSSCNIPATAQAYSLNYTSVPNGPLWYLTTWPAGQAQPPVSTLNAPTGTEVANAAIVQAGTNGDVSVFVSNNSDLVLDINGYFAPPGPGGLSLFPLVPCRVLDTRNPPGSPLELDPQGPQTSAPFSGTLPVQITTSGCGVPPVAPGTANAYVFNATVVPPGPLGYITLWPDGTPQPPVSTLNAIDGAVTSNMAIVPTNNGSIDAFASSPTHLVLDIYGYFAP